MFCQHCGNEVTAEPAIEAEHETEAIVSADVEIARINAERDIALARINARVTEVVNDAEQAADLAAAEAKAEALEEVIESSAEPETPPAVVVNPPPAEEPGTEIEPPPPAEPAAFPGTSRPKRSNWGFF